MCQSSRSIDLSAHRIRHTTCPSSCRTTRPSSRIASPPLRATGVESRPGGITASLSITDRPSLQSVELLPSLVVSHQLSTGVHVLLRVCGPKHHDRCRHRISRHLLSQSRPSHQAYLPRCGSVASPRLARPACSTPLARVGTGMRTLFPVSGIYPTSCRTRHAINLLSTIPLVKTSEAPSGPKPWGTPLRKNTSGTEVHRSKAPDSRRNDYGSPVDQDRSQIGRAHV